MEVTTEDRSCLAKVLKKFKVSIQDLHIWKDDQSSKLHTIQYDFNDLILENS